MLNKILVLYFCIIIPRFIFSQNEEQGLVTWLTFKEAQEKNKLLPKPFLIDVYTDWCGWCKHMMRTTYSNPGLANYINTNFYAVKFNAETKDTIDYNGKVYKPLSKEPKTPHELAVKFLGNSLSYPSTVFVTNNFDYNLLTQGYLEDKKIEPILIFMLENTWRTCVFDEFNKHFTNTFYDTVFKKIPVKAYSLSDVEKLQKTKPRKVLVNIGSGFCNTCMVMQKTTFVDSSIANYINANFYLVNLQVDTDDTLTFKNEKYYKSMVNNFPLNGLAVKLTNTKFSLPGLALLDEQMNTIDVMNYYQSPEQLRPVLAFIASNSYKTKTFTEFVKTYSDQMLMVSKKKKN